MSGRPPSSTLRGAATIRDNRSDNLLDDPPGTREAQQQDGLGRDFERLWRAFAISSLGTWLALDAFPLIAILALHASAAQVSLIAAASGAVGALLAVPLGPWIEFRSKRRLMVRADLIRFAALLTVPAAYILGVLTYVHLLVVAMVVALADIVFVGSSGAHLKALVAKRQLMEANGRFETASWITTAVGPPTGGALIGALGPVVTVLLNAVSFLLSAWGIRTIAAPEPAPPVRPSGGSRLAGIAVGWRAIAADRSLRVMLANNALVSAMIMATSPLLAYLMLHDLGFAPWQYGLGFGVPCLGGILGARLCRPLVGRYGQRRVLLGFGAARALWLVGLCWVRPGLPGLLLVMAVEAGMITCMGIYNPVFVTYRLQRTPDHTVARVLTAWTITTRTSVALATALWGLLATFTTPRAALATAGVLLLTSTALLPWRAASAESPAAEPAPEPVASS